MVEFLVGADAVAGRIRGIVIGQEPAVPHAVDLECASALRGLARGGTAWRGAGSCRRTRESGRLCFFGKMSLNRIWACPLLPRIWQLRHSMRPYEHAAL